MTDVMTGNNNWKYGGIFFIGQELKILEFKDDGSERVTTKKESG